MLDDVPGMSDRARCAVPTLAGTSHAAFVSGGEDGGVAMRFFTSAGELPACGHGTVAGLAVLAERAGGGEFRTTVRTAGRVLTGRASRSFGQQGDFTAAFDPGPVELSARAADELNSVLRALKLGPDRAPAAMCVASVGRPRLLVEVPTRAELAALVPDMERLRAACDQLRLLGCYVYSAPAPDGRAAARMFAPSIGVPEDIANANSTACLAAYLAQVSGAARTVAVDMGDSLGAPATVTAAAHPTASGLAVEVGGTAAIDGVVRLRP